MFFKILRHLWSLKRQFAKYFTVGLAGVGIDFVFMVGLKELADLRPVLAGAISQIFSIIFIFTANKYWSFGSKRQTKKQLGRYFIVLFFDYFYTVAAMYVFNDILSFDYRLVRLVSVALMVAWNFFLYKYFVYRQDSVVAEEGQKSNE